MGYHYDTIEAPFLLGGGMIKFLIRIEANGNPHPDRTTEIGMQAWRWHKAHREKKDVRPEGEDGHSV